MTITKTKNNRTLGLSESTSDGMSAKRSYASPAIHVVAFQVEAGFEPSTFVGDQRRSLDGIETYDRYDQQSDGSWAATDFNPYNEGQVFDN